MTGAQSAFNWRSASATHVGTVRKVNEDAFLDRREMGLWVVADGMGGHDAGDVASRTIIESFDDLPHPENRDSFLEELLVRLQEVNGGLQAYADERDLAVVGSTVALMFGFGREATCLWAGDSRIYMLRENQFRQLTKDHSQVEEMVNLGLLDRSEAESHPVGNVITRAVGAAESLAVDMVRQEVMAGDRYLLCSDGLNKVVPDDELSQIMQEHTCEDAPRALLSHALDRGTRDNVTAVVVHVDSTGL